MAWLEAKIEWLLIQQPAALLVASLGWPALVTALLLAVVGVYTKRSYLLIVASVLVLPVSFYLAGANSWMAIAGPLIPLSLLCACYASRHQKLMVAWSMLLVPLVLISCLAYLVLRQ